MILRTESSSLPYLYSSEPEVGGNEALVYLSLVLRVRDAKGPRDEISKRHT